LLSYNVQFVCASQFMFNSRFLMRLFFINKYRSGEQNLFIALPFIDKMVKD